VPATERAGVPGLRFHDLRHTAGTLATVAGATLREVMERLGHSPTAAAIRNQHVLTGTPRSPAAWIGSSTAEEARMWHASLRTQP
jgi:integrase